MISREQAQETIAALKMLYDKCDQNEDVDRLVSIDATLVANTFQCALLVKPRYWDKAALLCESAMKVFGACWSKEVERISNRKWLEAMVSRAGGRRVQ